MLRVFPVTLPTTISNDFGASRGGGTHGHEGNDLFSDMNAPLVAVDDGELRSGVDALGGNVLNLYASDGARYYYAHLASFANAAGTATQAPPTPRAVRTGDVVGFLGRTGNAATTQPHLHFEIHPCGRGRCAIDPFPALERAPRVAPNQKPVAAGAVSPLRAVAIAALAGAAAWSLFNPAEASRIARRVLPI